ncbi:MAG: hypothetical protein ACTHZ7_08380 [Sphingobacterium sp.]
MSRVGRVKWIEKSTFDFFGALRAMTGLLDSWMLQIIDNKGQHILGYRSVSG